MPISSADPATLRTYASRTQEVDADITAAGRKVTTTVDAFLATGPEFGAGIPPLGEAVTRHARVGQEVASWVRQVGAAFLRADGGTLDGRVITVDDSQLAPHIGFPTREAAEAAGRRMADEVREAIEHGEASVEDLRRWSEAMDRHRRDPVFTTSFFERLGVENTLNIPVLVERAYPREHYGRPQWGLDLLRPFSRGLATALNTTYRRGAHRDLPDEYRLDQRFADDLAEWNNPYDYDRPGDHHLGLLLGAGGRFPTDFLVKAANAQVLPHLWRETEGGPFGITPWGPGADTVVNVLNALGRNSDASLAFVRQRNEYLNKSTLELMLRRWSDLDDDGGRAAARVIDKALRHPDEAASRDVFREAVRVTSDLDEVRNFWLAPVLADAASRRMDMVAAAGRESTPRQEMQDMHDFLKVLMADEEGSKEVVAGALRYAAEVLNRPAGDSLAWEAVELGGLLGLIASADNHVRVDDAKQRIANRDALINGLSMAVDIGLTASKGKAIPFVGMGADKIFEMARSTEELDEALADNAVFRDRLRLGLSEALAARGVRLGEIEPGSGDGAWLDSEPVRDAIGLERMMGGQRFDEVYGTLADDK
jgi:hypothetical protein